MKVFSSVKYAVIFPALILSAGDLQSIKERGPEAVNGTAIEDIALPTSRTTSTSSLNTKFGVNAKEPADPTSKLPSSTSKITVTSSVSSILEAYIRESTEPLSKTSSGSSKTSTSSINTKADVLINKPVDPTTASTSSYSDPQQTFSSSSLAKAETFVNEPLHPISISSSLATSTPTDTSRTTSSSSRSKATSSLATSTFGLTTKSIAIDAFSETSVTSIPLPISVTYSANGTTGVSLQWADNSDPTTFADTWVTTYTRAPCSLPATQTDTQYCRVHVGTVQVHYFPTGPVTMNYTYPKTTVLSQYGLTMTSQSPPMVYYVINSMSALDWCGNLVGPVLTNVVTSYPLSSVSTLQAYANSWTASRNGDPQQLQLSDLKTNCPQYQTAPPDNHNVLGDYDPGCDPVLEWRPDLKNAGGPLWAPCGRYYGGKLGIFDPPIPVKPCTAGDCGDAGAGVITTQAPPTTTPAAESSPNPPVASSSPSPLGQPQPASSPVNVAPIATSTKDQTAANNPSIPSNSPPAAHPSSVEDPSPATPSHPQQSFPVISNDPPSAQSASAPPSVVQHVSNTPVAPANQPTPANNPQPTSKDGSGGSQTEVNNPVVLPSLASNSQQSAEGAANIAPTTPTPVPHQTLGVVGGQTVSGVGLDTSKALIGSQTLTIGGSVATIAGGQVASLGSQGVVIQAPSGVLTTFALPTDPAPVQTAILNGQTLSGQAIGSSQAVVQGHTLTLGEAAVTLSGNQIASFGTDGLVVKATDGTDTTITLPTAAPTPIATIAGQVFSGIVLNPSAAEIQGQTLTLGGEAITLSGNQVATLAPAGIIVTGAGDITTTIPLPTNSPKQIGVLAGQTISGAAIGTAGAVVQGQTLSIGGGVVTLNGGQVASLGSSGLVVQAPGGIVTTLSVPIPTLSGATTTTSSLPPSNKSTSQFGTSLSLATSSIGGSSGATSTLTAVIETSLGSPTSTATEKSTSTGIGAAIHNMAEGKAVKRGLWGFDWLVIMLLSIGLVFH